MKRRGFLSFLLIGCLMSCTKDDCRTFSSQETKLCIPESNILGSVMSLPEVSKNEIGFFLGDSMASDDRVIVTLTRREYLCQSFREEEAKRRCQTSGAPQKQSDKASEIVRTYTSATRSTWIYRYSGSADKDSLASCRSVSGRPGAGRCFTEGRYKDLAYSAIFYDPRPGGVLKVRTDVEEQIKRWEGKAR